MISFRENDVLAETNMEILNIASRLVAASRDKGKPITKLKLDFEIGKPLLVSTSTEEETNTIELEKFGTNVIEMKETLCINREMNKENLPAIEDMRKKGMTQTNIGVKLNIPQPTISKLLADSKSEKKKKSKKKGK